MAEGGSPSEAMELARGFVLQARGRPHQRLGNARHRSGHPLEVEAARRHQEPRRPPDGQSGMSVSHC